MMRVLAFLLLAASSLLADVVVLKDGTRVAGRVVEKSDFYEVTADGALRTFLKEEVQKVVKSPTEFLGDADKLFEDARADYHKAIALTDTAPKNALLKEAIAKVTRARESYSAALDLFPEDGQLGKQIMLLMQLMRLLRERVSHDDIGVRRPGPEPGRRARPDRHDPARRRPGDALDPAPERSGPAGRRGGLLPSQRTDLAAAAIVFLQKTDAEMRPTGRRSKPPRSTSTSPGSRNPAS
jgi:hypothetical protein